MEQWSLAEPGQCIWKNSFLSINIGQERLLPSQALDCGPALIKWLASHPHWYLSALAVLLSSISTECCSPEGRQWKSHSAPVQRTLTVWLSSRTWRTASFRLTEVQCTVLFWADLMLYELPWEGMWSSITMDLDFPGENKGLLQTNKSTWTANIKK